jgi:hypothetical protein
MEKSAGHMRFGIHALRRVREIHQYLPYRGGVFEESRSTLRRRVLLALFRNFMAEKAALQRMSPKLWQVSSALGKDIS